MERSGSEKSTHYITAKQLNSAKILRAAALTQDDSLFVPLSFLGYLFIFNLMRQHLDWS
jgi:hypothetical protein